MSIDEILDVLQTQSNPTRIKVNEKNGNLLPQFGVPMGVLRKLANEIGINQSLAISLWAIENLDTRMLAVMIMDPEEMSKKEIDMLAKQIDFCYLMDEFVDDVVFEHKDREYFLDKWSKSKQDILGRGGWYLIVKELLGNECLPQKIDEYLDVIQKELKDTSIKKQEAMNRALCEIGIHYPNYTKKCLKIGEELGVYKEMKVSKGCTSPYALEWIRVGLAKKKEKVKK